MPKIIVDDGCCSNLFNAYRQYEAAANKSLEDLNECLKAAENFYNDALKKIDETHPCVNPQSYAKWLCGSIERMIQTIDWLALRAGAEIDYLAEKAKCEAKYGPGLVFNTKLMTDALQDYIACRLLAGCGGVITRSTDGGSPGPAGQTPTLPQY